MKAAKSSATPCCRSPIMTRLRRRWGRRPHERARAVEDRCNCRGNEGGARRRAVRPRGAPLLIVADVLAALRDVGRAARARSSARIAAVTGSVGKTGTKEALRL